MERKVQSEHSERGFCMERSFTPFKIRELMTRNVVTVNPDEVATKAAKLMTERKIGSIVVMSRDEVAGIVTERDVVEKIASRGVNPDTVKVRDIMSSPVITCTSDTLVSDAVKLMRERRIRHLPIVDKGKLVGIVAARDLISLGWTVIIY